MRLLQVLFIVIVHVHVPRREWINESLVDYCQQLGNLANGFSKHLLPTRLLPH